MFIVHLAGNLGRDPETRFTPGGQKVTTLTLAVNQRKGKEDHTTWVRVTIWGDRFDKMISYLKKGSPVIVVGRMSPPTSYVDKEGKTQISLEVTAELLEFSPFGKGGEKGSSGPAAHAAAAGPSPVAGQASPAHFGSAYEQRPAPFGGAQAGEGSFGNSSIDEDALPF